VIRKVPFICLYLNSDRLLMPGGERHLLPN
jgi:hypothetical protein